MHGLCASTRTDATHYTAGREASGTEGTQMLRAVESNVCQSSEPHCPRSLSRLGSAITFGPSYAQV